MQNYRNYTPDYGRRPTRNTYRPDMMSGRQMNREGNCDAGCAAGRNLDRGADRAMPDKDCPCNAKKDPLRGMALAMAYVPWQPWSCPMDLDKALCCGTIFEDLNKPFLMKGGMGR